MVTVEETENILKITIEDVASRNSLSRPKVQELATILKNVSLNIRAIILSSAGDVFCSGHNLKELQRADREAAQSLFTDTLQIFSLIREVDVPVVAAMNGPAIGAGVQLALSCDAIVAADDAYFATFGGSKGWFCFTPAVDVFARLPKQAAIEMLFSGNPLTTPRAAELGLVNKVVPRQLVAASADQLARALSQGNREMLALGKRFYREYFEDLRSTRDHVAAELMTSTLFTLGAQRRIGNITPLCSPDSSPIIER